MLKIDRTTVNTHTHAQQTTNNKKKWKEIETSENMKNGEHLIYDISKLVGSKT